jgi:hypothetical protein
MLKQLKKNLISYAFLLLVFPPIFLPIIAIEFGNFLTVPVDNIDCCAEYREQGDSKFPSSYLLYAGGWASSLMIDY